MMDDEVHVFGHFVVGGTVNDGIIFRAVAIAEAAEEAVAQINGEVMVVSDMDDSIANIGGRDVAPVDGALLLDGYGNPVGRAANGQEAESWGVVDPLAADLPNPFPSFLTQIKSGTDEDSLDGSLFAVGTESITILTEDTTEACVTVTGDTEIQHIVGWNVDAEVSIITIAQLGEISPDSDVVAFGEFDDGTPPCLVADVIVVETN